MKKTGIELIRDERKRQIDVEGFDEKHDSQYATWEQPSQRVLKGSKLVAAASCYEQFSFIGWPWDIKWWKPTPNDPVKQLVKSGALYRAELDRLKPFVDQERVHPDLKMLYDSLLIDIERVANKIDKLLL